MTGSPNRMLLVLLVGAGLCFGCAFYVWYVEAGPTHQRLVVEDPDRELGFVTRQVETPVIFRIFNMTANDCTFMGMRESCGIRCCLSSKQREATIIRAGSVFELECVLKVELAGKFEAEMVLLLHDGKVQEQTVTVRGTGSQ